MHAIRRLELEIRAREIGTFRAYGLRVNDATEWTDCGPDENHDQEEKAEER